MAPPLAPGSVTRLGPQATRLLQTALELITMGGIQIGSILDQDPGGVNPKMLGMKSGNTKMAPRGAPSPLGATDA